jgi:GTPase involved in cell partitioning and DNA repair
LKYRNDADNKGDNGNSKNSKGQQDENVSLTCPKGAWLKLVKTIEVFDDPIKKADKQRCIVCSSGLRFCHRYSNFQYQTKISFNEIVHLKCNKTGCFNNSIATNRTRKNCGYKFPAGTNVVKLF